MNCGDSFELQTFTPHMQPTVAKCSDVTSGSGTKKTVGRRNSLVNHEQGNFSTELWQKAFKDARERLCPLRAGGHECGCLSVLVRMVRRTLNFSSSMHDISFSENTTVAY